MSTKIFLAPGLLAHIRKSVIEGVQADELIGRDSRLKELVQHHYVSTKARLWGLKDTLKGLWNQANHGDYILFYHAGNFEYAGKILFRYPFEAAAGQVEEATKIAEKVWGKDPQDGKTWSYLIFIGDIMEAKIPLEKFNELTGYKFEAKPGKAVIHFMKVREDRAGNLLTFLDGLYKAPAKSPEITPTLPDLHEQIAQKIYELGEVIGYRPEKKWRREGYEYDVVWHKPPREGPKCVFEVHIKGNLGDSLLRLKHAYDRWESQLFLVSTEDQINEAKSKYLVGALHELGESGALTLLKIDEVEGFHKFKSQFEWLERRFGLRPR
jgi:predicted RNA-binding protein